jgi:hypothetical protein
MRDVVCSMAASLLITASFREQRIFRGEILRTSRHERSMGRHDDRHRALGALDASSRFQGEDAPKT